MVLFSEPALTPVDTCELSHLRRINPGVHESLAAIADPDKDDGYFYRLPNPPYDMRHDFEKMVKVFNLNNETRVLRLGIRLDYPVGNAFIILREAITYCGRFGIGKLYVDFGKQYPHAGDCFTFDGSLVEKTEFQKLELPPDCALLLFEDFFLLLYGVFRRGPHPRATMDFLSRSFIPRSDDPYPVEKLVVHIRSGDIFGPGVVHTTIDYLQPPLVWYKKCIEAHRRHHRNISVLMVYWNESNPCIGALRSWCRETGIPVEEQSEDAVADYRCLMRARALIDSRGSFTEIARKLNQNLKIMYRFERRYFAGGSYDRPGEWRYTPEVKEQMLTIGETELFLPADLYTDAFCLHRYQEGYLDSRLTISRRMVVGLARIWDRLLPSRLRSGKERPLYERLLLAAERRIYESGANRQTGADGDGK